MMVLDGMRRGMVERAEWTGMGLVAGMARFDRDLLPVNRLLCDAALWL